MVKNQMASLFKGHQTMKTRMEKSEASLKGKDLELKKVHPGMKKNGEELQI